MNLRDTGNCLFENNETNHINDIEKSSAIKKKRGAPKGVLRGPRPTYFIGSAIDKNNQLIMKSLLVSTDDMSDEEAADDWEKEYGLRPAFILGPFYEKKTNNSQSSQKKKENLSIDLNSLTFSGEKKYGEYNGWEVTVQLLKDPKDYGWLLFKKEIGEEGGRKKQKPASKAVKLNQIQNLRDSL